MPFHCPRRRFLAAGTLLLTPIGYAQEKRPQLDVNYVPTPPAVVNRMLALARVRRGDLVYDLGCGDGRIVIAAAKKRHARGVGIDLDPERIREARENAAREGVEQQVEFHVGDLFQTDFSPGTVVTLYLLPQINQKLRPQLWQQLKAGTRIVSHEFDMGEEWPPDRSEIVAGRSIHLWTVKPRHKKT